MIKRVAPRLRACTAARCSNRMPNPRRRACGSTEIPNSAVFDEALLVETQMSKRQ